MRAAALSPHHTSDELEVLYRGAHRPIERSRWHILWLKSKGKTIPEIVDATGYARTTISTLIRNYNRHGVDGVLDRRQFNKSDPALNSDQQQQLFEALQRPPPDADTWSIRHVQTYIETHFEVIVTKPCAWGYLRRLGFTVQVPRPTHVQSASPEAREAYLKKSTRP